MDAAKDIMDKIRFHSKQAQFHNEQIAELTLKLMKEENKERHTIPAHIKKAVNGRNEFLLKR